MLAIGLAAPPMRWQVSQRWSWENSRPASASVPQCDGSACAGESLKPRYVRLTTAEPTTAKAATTSSRLSG